MADLVTHGVPLGSDSKKMMGRIGMTKIVVRGGFGKHGQKIADPF